jgi:hypothetical protein
LVLIQLCMSAIEQYVGKFPSFLEIIYSLFRTFYQVFGVNEPDKSLDSKTILFSYCPIFLSGLSFKIRANSYEKIFSYPLAAVASLFYFSEETQ